MSNFRGLALLTQQHGGNFPVEMLRLLEMARQGPRWVAPPPPSSVVRTNGATTAVRWSDPDDIDRDACLREILAGLSVYYHDRWQYDREDAK